MSKKFLGIFMWVMVSAQSGTAFAKGDVVVITNKDDDHAATLTENLRKTHVQDFSGYYTVENLTCIVKNRHKKRYPYTHCDYTAAAPMPSRGEKVYDMGTRSAALTYVILRRAGATVGKLTVGEKRNHYVDKISAKKVFCKVDGTECGLVK